MAATPQTQPPPKKRKWLIIFALGFAAILCYRSLAFAEKQRTLAHIIHAYTNNPESFLDISDADADSSLAESFPASSEKALAIAEDFLETTLETTKEGPHRTSQVAYNQVDDGARYFVYSPSGGFNNQRKELESAMRVAIVLNRTLLVPMIAKHTSGWSRYHDLTNESLLPADVLLDFKLMEQYSPKLKIVPMNMPVKQFEQQLKGKQMMRVFFTKHREQWYGPREIKQAMAGFDQPILFLKGASMYHKWFSKEIMERLRPYVSYSRYIRRIALEFMKVLGTEYNAVHIRLGDYMRMGRIPSASFLVHRLETSGFIAKKPLYIATEPARPDGYFKPFEKKWKVSYSTSFRPLIRQFKGNFPVKMRNDVLGLVEQMICVGARKFAGTGYSNFSDNIKFMRRHRNMSFPELIDFRKRYESSSDK